MMQKVLTVLGAVWIAASPVAAQSLPVDNPVLRAIWSAGMEQSQTPRLVQTLTDSIGPRLTGSPGMQAGQEWLLATYRQWGIPARREQYGTWLGWRRGLSRVELLAPRVRSLEGMLLAWSAGTGGKPVDAGVAILPDLPDSAAYAAWMRTEAKGRFVMLSVPQATCRPDSSFRSFALPETWAAMTAQRESARTDWAERLRRTGLSARVLPRHLEDAGAAGVVTSQWSSGWGVTKIFQGRTVKTPTVELSCEDYGLVFRLAQNNQGPRLRITADAEFRGDVPVFNVVAEIRGTERPDEYVMLSAHFDSWDGSSGATDNATGTVTMLEAMRLLKTHYPAPRRTILVGHWSGEEQGLNGSRAFAEDHPEVVSGLQALFNQDNGTGRVVSISASGFTEASPLVAKWVSALPSELSRHITLNLPGSPAGGGSDHAAFVCHGAPGFSLSSLNWEYGTYTWHTNRDTFDKVVLDELKANATLAAMLVYLASEEPATTPRARRTSGTWPACSAPARSWAESTR